MEQWIDLVILWHLHISFISGHYPHGNPSATMAYHLAWNLSLYIHQLGADYPLMVFKRSRHLLAYSHRRMDDRSSRNSSHRSLLAIWIKLGSHPMACWNFNGLLLPNGRLCNTKNSFVLDNRNLDFHFGTQMVFSRHAPRYSLAPRILSANGWSTSFSRKTLTNQLPRHHSTLLFLSLIHISEPTRPY